MFESTHFRGQPLYVRLRQLLDDRLAAGEWNIGTRLPPEPDLAILLDSDITGISAALDIMDEEHLVVRMQSGGTFVTGYAPSKKNGATPASAELNSRRELAMFLVRLLSWAGDEAIETLHDDIVAKHLGAASERLHSRFAVDRTDRPA